MFLFYKVQPAPYLELVIYAQTRLGDYGEKMIVLS